MAKRILPYLLAILFSAFAIGAALSQNVDAANTAKLAARWTARAALPLFLVAYAASSLMRLWPNDVTRRLVRNRRHWGLSFALAHTVHLVALGINLLIYGETRPLLVLLGGGTAYGLMFAMVFTSSDAGMRKLGKNWKRLHTIGIHYTWIVFFQSYAGAAFRPEPDKYIWGSAFALLLFAALGLRFAVWLRQRQKIVSA